MLTVSFQKYIYATLKNLDQDTGISSKAMSDINDMINIIAVRVCQEALAASRMNGRYTVGKNDVILACQRVLPSELSKHCNSEINKACVKYKNSFA